MSLNWVKKMEYSEETWGDHAHRMEVGTEAATTEDQEKCAEPLNHDSPLYAILKCFKSTKNATMMQII